MQEDPLLGDSIAFTMQAYRGFLFETNATNHFLYSNFLSLLYKLLPGSNIHYLCVSVSIFSALLFLFYFRRFLEFLGVTPRSSLICMMAFGLSFTFWRQSIITEVYTFYLLFVILFLLSAFKYLESKNISHFYYSCVFLGILFLIHIQTVLFIPFCLYFLFKEFKNLKNHIISGITVFLLISFILLIPAIQGKHDFLAILTDDAYQNSLFNYNIKIIAKSIIKNSTILFYNFNFFIIFLILGLNFKKNIFYIILILLPFIMFCIKHSVSDIYVFQLVPYIFFWLIVGKGIDRFPKKYYLFLPLLLPLIYFVSYKMLSMTPIGEKYNVEKNYKGGIRYMTFPPLNGNPPIDLFIRKFETNNIFEDKAIVRSSYLDALRWQKIKSKPLKLKK